MDSHQEEKIKTLLEEGIQDLDINLSEQNVHDILLYTKELIKWNDVYNLTGIKSPEENITKNILDSLSVLPFVQGESLLDVGTGAGLPGMVLAIVQPQQSWVLVDSNGKKTRFLKQIKQILKLDNVTVENCRVESLANKYKFDGITSRAFATIPDSLKLCEHLLKSGSRFYALKGKIKDVDTQQLPAWATVESIKQLSVFGIKNEERHLITICINNG